jgi:hypothetical protein
MCEDLLGRREVRARLLGWLRTAQHTRANVFANEFPNQSTISRTNGLTHKKSNDGLSYQRTFYSTHSTSGISFHRV